MPVRPIMTTATTRVPAATAPYLLDDAMLAPLCLVKSFSDATAPPSTALSAVATGAGGLLVAAGVAMGGDF